MKDNIKKLEKLITNIRVCMSCQEENDFWERWGDLDLNKGIEKLENVTFFAYPVSEFQAQMMCNDAKKLYDKFAKVYNLLVTRIGQEGKNKTICYRLDSIEFNLMEESVRLSGYSQTPQTSEKDIKEKIKEDNELLECFPDYIIKDQWGSENKKSYDIVCEIIGFAKTIQGKCKWHGLLYDKIMKYKNNKLFEKKKTWVIAKFAEYGIKLKDRNVKRWYELRNKEMPPSVPQQ